MIQLKRSFHVVDFFTKLGSAIALLSICMIGGQQLIGAEMVTQNSKSSQQDCVLVARDWISQNRARFGLLDTQFVISNGSFCFQFRNLQNSVPFDRALGLAIESILNDDHDIESPLAILLEVIAEQLGMPFQNPYPEIVYRTARVKLLKWLSEGASRISLMRLDQPAENGESVRENWIFRIKIPQLSDHIYWAIVDRSGLKDAYNYGFN